MYVQKSHKLQETTLSMFELLDRSSAVKCKTRGSRDKPQLTSMAGNEKFGLWSPESVDIHGISRDLLKTLIDPLDEKEINFQH